MPNQKKLQELAELKSQFIDDQLIKFEKLLDRLGPLLNKYIIDEFISKLSVEKGFILSNVQNQRLTALVNQAYETFMINRGYRIMTTMIEDMYALSGYHSDYFNELQGMAVNNDSIKKIVYERLGLNEKGELKKDGFMKGLFDNPSIKNDIRDFALEKVTNGTGFEDLRTGMKDLILGQGDKMGAFKQFYRNTAYDTYAKIDRLNGKLYRDKLGLKYFIYAGTRRKTSRHFCIKRKGKVFSEEEALKWKDLIGTYETDDSGKKVPAGPIVSGEDVATYNPFIDCGGYGCVDDIMWISEEIAFVRRPDLKKL
jgi:hypothetical protein